ncbi:coproporphyrinogen III oxidase family protein [Anaplasma phagocytophilum str. NCH-1]|uniref:Coproporphyrinogen III oxidase family protein n=1 Tax=Anaplasma phagocytophilum str. NCH-1 TaxID=1359161 RepID=A0A0F3NED6_ANAPH|nr:coproporphyrinogen III oxidase family protein [Anaplasma phagocytophilum str. NCH-1]
MRNGFRFVLLFVMFMAIWQRGFVACRMVLCCRFTNRSSRFGLMTDGNSDAIMMSMPPLAKWV